MYYIPGAVMKKQPTATAVLAGNEWRLIKEIGCSGEVREVTRVAICNDDNIAVVGWGGAYLLHNGQYHRITSPDNKEAKLIAPNDVTVTPNNIIIITDTSKYIKLFHPDGQYMRSICTISSWNPFTEVNTMCVAVSSQGFIVVGDRERDLITIHSESDNSFYKNIKTRIEPWCIAVTSQLNILVSDWSERKVVAYNMESGGEVFVIDSWKLAGDKSGDAGPMGLACDTEGNVYIAVGTLAPNTGHVHVYNEQGQYLQCIVKGLYFPCGLAWYNNSLYIADDRAGLKIYSNV